MAEVETSKAEVLANELREELPQLFDINYTPKWDLYEEKVEFMDPLNKFEGIKKYRDNIQLLKDSPLFTGGKMDLHEVTVLDPSTVFTRWTLAMTFKAFPWKPRLLFTGTTKYTINPQSGLVTRHEDTWDSIDDNNPVSLEAVVDLVGQLSPIAPIAAAGVRTLKRAGEEAAPYSVLRRFKENVQVRRYEALDMVQTPRGQVYDRDSYNAANTLLLGYRGDALTAAENTAGRVLASTEPLLQFDSGKRDSSLAYVLPRGLGTGSPPTPKDGQLAVVSLPARDVAVYSVRGFGNDRGRTEEAIEGGLRDLRAAVESKGWTVTEEGGAFTLASYADGYELWLSVAAGSE